MKLTRALAAVAASAIVGLGSLAAGASPASAASWRYAQLDGDWCYDVAYMDWNGNGNLDDLRFDLDNDCRFDARLWDTRGGDWLLEAANFDMNENGFAELQLLDTNQAAGYEVTWHNPNDDGYWDYSTSTGYYTTVGPPTDPGGFYTLMNTLAAHTGVARW